MMRGFGFVRVIVLVVLATFWLGLPDWAEAQTYRFHVRQLDLEVFVLPSASVRLEYTIELQNDPTASPIDVVDIGLPHPRYDLGSMRAAMNGEPLVGIRPSTYIDVGVEVPLGPLAIPPGGRGTFAFSCVMPDMVYEDLTDTNYASLQIKPTWFDPQLQTGTTRLRIGVHLPPGVRAEEVRYQDEQLAYDSLGLVGTGADAHVVAFWEFPNHTLSAANPKVGVSFPQRVMQRVVEISRWQLLVNWFSENPPAQYLSALLLMGIFVFTYYRFAHGTGWVLGLLGVGLLIFVFVISPALHLMLWPVLIALCVLNEYALRRRRKQYLPAMATVEGGGVKRGLTAPQAAVLLERPLGQVLTLVLFGLLKKQVLRAVRQQPLQVEVTEPFRITREGRLKEAEKLGVALHEYEHPFIDRLLSNKPLEEIDFNEALGSLVKATAGRMKGFDLSDTREYYRRIAQRAWQEAESLHEVEQRMQTADRHFEWMMMDPDWGRRFTTWRDRGYEYRPRWIRTTTPGGHSTSPSLPAPSRGSASTTQTSASEVAASFVGFAENTTGRLAAAIEPAKLGLAQPRGVVDLTTLDTITGDVLEAMAKNSGGRGGGGGGGCACACAGCACACACAGGGR